LKEAREQIATNKSFISYYRPNDRNGTSQRSIADPWLPPSSTRSRFVPHPPSYLQQTSSMPICSRQCENCTCFAPSDRQWTNSGPSWAPTSVSRRASISDRRHSCPSTYSQRPRSCNSSQETGSSYSNYSMSTCPISTMDSMKAHLGGRLS
jgi:hypothetical protein